jgi:hypothetical protein
MSLEVDGKPLRIPFDHTLTLTFAPFNHDR